MSFFPSLAFLTDSAGAGEWIVLFVVILIVVGPQKLPGVVRKIGRTMEMFRRAADEFKDQLMSMDQETSAHSSPPPAAPKTDVDGVPSPGTPPDGSKASAAGSHDDAYPNMADYPGNEHHVENWPANAPQEHHAAVPTPSDSDSAKTRPSEGKA